MTSEKNTQITVLLDEWGKGEEKALTQLMPLVYDEMRLMAKRHMRGQSSGHTFNTTDLIHEAYVKIAGQDEANWKNRAHFFGVAAQTMRHILVDHARSKNSLKRGGGWQNRISLDENAIISEKQSDDLLALDEALEKLSEFDERKCRVVELKFFGGLTADEIAGVLNISPDTVYRDWNYSRAWLSRELSGESKK